MSTVEIIQETPLTLAEVKEKLDAIKKRDIELTIKGKKVETYLTQFLQASNTKKLIDEIKKLEIARLKDKHIVKIVDLLPKDTDSLHVILAEENITIKEENLKRIIDVVKEHA